MIGVDTNVLVRLFIIDEPQSAMSKRFFAGCSPGNPCFVSLLVMAELAWVLRRKYEQPPKEIGRVVQSILDSDDFVVEGREVVEWALSNYGPAGVDFSDLLIARSGHQAGAPRTITFDKRAAKHIDGVELLA